MIAGCLLVAKLFGLRTLSFQDRVPNVEVGNQRERFTVGRQPFAAERVGMGMPTYNCTRVPTVDVGNPHISVVV